MSEIILDLDKIKQCATEKNSDLLLFFEKVKKISVNEFDKIAHPIVEELTQKIDCTQCGNCCRHQEPGVTTEEIKQLASCKNISSKDFKNEYIAWDKDGISFMFRKPCTFLNGKKCSVYDYRPGSCADFPGLHRPALKWRMKQVKDNYSICPIVFNVVERLKNIV